MWFWLFFVPILLGTVAVIQSGLLKQIGEQWGLTNIAILLNLVQLACFAILFTWVKLQPSTFPEIFKVRGSLSELKALYILPGFFGVMLILGIPLTIQKIGVLKLFIMLIGAQLAVSMVWDYYVESIPITFWRILGTFIALVGAYITTIQKD